MSSSSSEQTLGDHQELVQEQANEVTTSEMLPWALSTMLAPQLTQAFDEARFSETGQHLTSAQIEDIVNSQNDFQPQFKFTSSTGRFELVAGDVTDRFDSVMRSPSADARQEVRVWGIYARLWFPPQQ